MSAREDAATFLAALVWHGTLFIRTLLRIAALEILRDPQRAAATRPVFELLAA